MAGVFEQLFRPQKKAMSQKAMELEAAREILAEVFRVRVSEVEEMLRQRSEGKVQSCTREVALWPESFCLVE
ncbi:MAG: hypothetical protein WAW52_05380 [Methanothrix sp.]